MSNRDNEPKDGDDAKPIAEAKGYRKMTTWKLFCLRMKRDGRFQEFQTRYRELKPTFGNKAKATAMREFGYINAQVERAAAMQYERTLAARDASKRNAAMRGPHAFEVAFAMLPDTAAPKTEMDWIRAHPAMMRKIRAKDTIATIQLTAQDVLSPPHGQAPSKSAVLALQHWANKPDEFFKMLMTEHKKNSEAAASAEKKVESVADLQEVERMLMEMRSGTTS